MRAVFLFLVSILASQRGPTQVSDDVRPAVIHTDAIGGAPLMVFTNGPGRVVPFGAGRILEVGGQYTIRAIPAPGYRFSSWQPARVFNFIEMVIDASGNSLTLTNTVVSPLPTFYSQRALRFTMQPITVIYDDPGVREITETSGWIANFVPATTDY